MAKMERRLAAILVTDVVGYSRLMSRDEEGTLRRVKELLSDLMRPKIAEHRGSVMKTMGDGVLAEFSSVFEAFQCAVEIHEGLEERNAPYPPQLKMELRMGLNVGDVIFDEGDFFGDGVNIAARLERLAEPGGICISGRVYEDLRKLQLAFKDLGEQNLKNIDQPVRAYGLSKAQRPTVYNPNRVPLAGEEPAAAGATVATPAPPATSGPPGVTQSQTLAGAAPGGTVVPQVIKVGDVLNHIFEVTRFIARGGMGEVFEGKNVNSDERVAIKVILPALANDERVIAMFQREARTLTRLHHPSLVQYRVLAREPQLGVLYIVTEYIDGVNLSDFMRGKKPSAEDLSALLRSLASGLGAAHALGAIHRDMSPDNVLLADGKLSGAKIIDFGIAKDLDTSVATIVGDGFAGKLNYVAPEQLGDYGRDVGPWTDVYSLALVIIAVASGEQVKMGRTLVEAVDKRRAEVDISPVPDKLKPVLEAMLRSNPAERLRSMDEVLAMLDGAVPPAQSAAARAAQVAEPPAARSKAPLIAGVAAAVLLAAVGGYFLLQPGRPGGGPVAASDTAQQARDAINSAIPSVACSWLDIVDVGDAEGKVAVRLTGAAGEPQRAQSQIARVLEGAGLTGATVDATEIADITAGGCSALDAFTQIRDSDSGKLEVSQREWKLEPQTSGPYAGEPGANPAITMKIGDPSADLALIGMEPSGAITSIIRDRAQLAELQQDPSILRPLADDAYEFRLPLNHAGWSGLVLFVGKGPFPADLVSPDLGARGPDWRLNLARMAADRGWKADMVWFRTVE